MQLVCLPSGVALGLRLSLSWVLAHIEILDLARVLFQRSYLRGTLQTTTEPRGAVVSDTAASVVEPMPVTPPRPEVLDGGTIEISAGF